MNASGHSLRTGEAEFLAHVLAIVGLRGDGVNSQFRVRLRPELFDDADGAHVDRGGILLAVCPGDRFCDSLGVLARGGFPPGDFIARSSAGSKIVLRSLHASSRYSGDGVPCLTDDAGEALWFRKKIGRGSVLICGTDLAGDMMRFRQGDPAMALHKHDAELWGIPGERPVYLFERQLDRLSKSDERQADLWAMHCAMTVVEDSQMRLAEVLPNGAAGAVVITGDDDQALLANYEEQLRLLDGLPITYFLHPQTRHTAETIASMFAGRRIELGLHPDALEAPHSYARLLREQTEWFHQLTRERPVSVRNHGFLNDGYWGHLPHWLANGLRISSNLPGVDGRALNGSLLPARLCLDDRLVDHWSIVTAIGDGIRYVDGGRSDEAAAQCIYDCAQGIVSSGLPGVMVLNLHPQNVRDTGAMHASVREVVQAGFHAWTLSECVSWFESATGARPESRFSGVLRRVASLFGPKDRRGEHHRWRRA